LEDFIHIRGARVHNLKDIEVGIPRNKLVVFTGVSGSGKSSLAFDTIYAEGQRRYLESLSSYARQFLMQFDKPDVDFISGLSPAIAIEQKSASHNPRSTVGTVTEIYDYLRVLYARLGKQFCYKCGKPVGAQSVDQMVDAVTALPVGTKLYILAPVVAGRKGEYKDVFDEARKAGFVRVRVNGDILSLDGDIILDKKRKHEIEIVVDRLTLDAESPKRLSESIEAALEQSQGLVVVHLPDGKRDIKLSEKNACVDCGISYDELTPQTFSFNNPYGMCKECDGLGTLLEVDEELLVPDPSLSVGDGAIKLWGPLGGHREYFEPLIDALLARYGTDTRVSFRKLPRKAQEALLYGDTFEYKGRQRDFEGAASWIKRLVKQTQSEDTRRWYFSFMGNKPCTSCSGKKLNPAALAVRFGGVPIDELVAKSVDETLAFFSNLTLGKTDQTIGKDVIKEIRQRLKFLVDVGLHYLTLERSAPSLSGGESQRIRLASQIGSGLVGVLYILDEPSIGLHQRDNRRLIATLKSLRDLGNSVIVVEHDEGMMRESDEILDFGPGAGIEGGRIVAQGTWEKLAKDGRSLTGKYLSGELFIPVPPKRRAGTGKVLQIRGARANNLKRINVDVPLGRFICVTGVSGSGKSSLINETLYNATANVLHGSVKRTGMFDEIRGLQNNVDKVVNISQKPIGRTPRSNPATYTGVFDDIRNLFAQLPEAKVRGFKPGRFSFNVRGGRCEACEGAGVKKIEMHFLADVYVTCDICGGKRFNRETLAVKYKGRNIHEVLSMTVREALRHFENIPAIVKSLQTLYDVGLDYVQLGQSAPTLSGGESQRVKLAKELSRRSTGKTLYLLDEPTTGLHFDDIRKLLEVLNRLVDAGNTVIVIEHNLDVIKCADWIIDLGPEGGEMGGRVVAVGTPEDVAVHPTSYTGQFLRRVLTSRNNRKDAKNAKGSGSRAASARAD